ncbi:MAG: hypothetical protein AB9891_00400 [Anaerolineaceae bacterium]
MSFLHTYFTPVVLSLLTGKQKSPPGRCHLSLTKASRLITVIHFSMEIVYPNLTPAEINANFQPSGRQSCSLANSR